MSLSRRKLLFGTVALTATATLGGCVDIPLAVVNAILPEAPPYPFESLAKVNAEATALSDRLADFIEDWLDGRGPANIPEELMPVGYNSEAVREVRLIKPQDINSSEQWASREAHYRLDRNNTPGLYPDPHCTYMVPGLTFLPFGYKAIIEGEFPYARFFSIQVTPPFDPRYYYYGSAFGAPEVPIVDADIDPLPGHTNPFRVGANRKAQKRSYRVELEMAQGYGPAIEPAYKPPHFRARGNRRLGSGIVYQGPMGLKDYRLGHGRGLWDIGHIWMRYYAPDRDKGPYGGVDLPKITYLSPSGREFYIDCDIETKRRELNAAGPIKESDPVEPTLPATGRPIVWDRDLDILHAGIVGIFQATGKTTPEDKLQGRALVKGFTAHGTDVPAPGPWMGSASRVPYISYLAGGGSLGPDKVLVLSGRLPRHPNTLNGDAIMTGGQVRYMSITAYVVADFLGGGIIGQPISSVMDEDIITDAEGNYLICYSRASGRPRNATARNGITWVDWGPVGTVNFNLRWMTVDADWKDRRITPDDVAVPYAQASWLETSYNPSLVGYNGQSRVMGPYCPTFHYLSRTEFEALGQNPIRSDLKIWGA
jgi:hypothetical protein